MSNNNAKGVNEEFRNFLQTDRAKRLRLAPTPSGYLHLGNGINFVLNHIAAQMQPKGRLLLRIDDLDAARKRPEYIQDIFETLDWLGIEWEEGPSSPDDFERNWSQYRRMDLYEDLLAKLAHTGLVFACGKSRNELSEFGNDYPKAFRDQKLSLHQKGVSWRIKTPEGFPLCDFVVRRRDGIPAYQVASLADDVHFGMTHLIRGADLEPSSQAQQYLAQLIDLQEFKKINLFHHPLVHDENGVKLSKSAGANSLKSIRENGGKPAYIFQAARQIIGLENDTNH